ncbi:MAG TPA: DUF4190 domain-containing protein [Tepidisphaeraceae bacterium]|jgi:hypothetical protein
MPAPAYANRAGLSEKGKAITGFWLSLGGLFLAPAAIVGVIMCGIAITNMSSSNNEEGKGFAKAGLIIGFIVILVWVMILKKKGGSMYLSKPQNIALRTYEWEKRPLGSPICISVGIPRFFECISPRSWQYSAGDHRA